MIRGHRIGSPPVHRPRCEVVITIENPGYEWRLGHAKRHPERYPHPWERCVRKATYHIEGRDLCTQHAGVILLDQLFPPPAEKPRGWRLP